MSLYLIEILHQTTTRVLPRLFLLGCILSKFYIKPQPNSTVLLSSRSCILSKFYIKPQQLLLKKETLLVVSYRNSTSNHNLARDRTAACRVVSYRNSTSNHNYPDLSKVRHGVVSYRNSTSNHNTGRGVLTYSSVVSYRNSTSNHNTESRL